MDLIKELTSAGVAPTGPVSAWPQERHDKLMGQARATQESKATITEPKIKPGMRQMAQNIVKVGGQALRNGKVSREVREERYETCKQCPSFNKASKRCSECGCFMEAKTWVGGDPKLLCPLMKWAV